MRRLLFVLITVLLGPTGCVTGMVRNELRKTSVLHIENVESYSAEAGRIGSVCIVGHFNLNESQKYGIKVPAKSWSYECQGEFGVPGEWCENYVPLYSVQRSDVKTRCETATESPNFDVQVEENTRGARANKIISISNPKNGKKLFTLTTDEPFVKTSLLFIPILPVLILVDVVTFPLQATYFLYKLHRYPMK